MGRVKINFILANRNLIEWNYRFTKCDYSNDFNVFYDKFEDPFNNHSLEISDETVSAVVEELRSDDVSKIEVENTEVNKKVKESII